MITLLVNSTAPFILLIIHASDEHKSCLSYMTLLGKTYQKKYVPRYYKKYAPAGSRARGTSMGGMYATATLLALLHRNGLRRTRRDCVIFPLL